MGNVRIDCCVFFVATFHIITPLRPFGTSKKRSERFCFAVVACILSGGKYQYRLPRLAHSTSFWTWLTLSESDHFLFWFWPFSTWKIHNVATTLIHTKGRTQSQIMWTHFSGQLQRWVNIRCKCHTLKKRGVDFLVWGERGRLLLTQRRRLTKNQIAYCSPFCRSLELFFLFKIA